MRRLCLTAARCSADATDGANPRDTSGTRRDSDHDGWVGGVRDAQRGAASNAPRCGAGVHDSQALGVVGFPDDQIFCPTFADPKEAQSFVSLLRGTFRSLDDPSARGRDCVRRTGRQLRPRPLGGPEANEGVQLDVVGSIFAQFDLGAPSNDLINADYLIGLPLSSGETGSAHA